MATLQSIPHFATLDDVASDQAWRSRAGEERFNPAPGTWSVIQTYRLVDGTQRIGDSGCLGLCGAGSAMIDGQPANLMPVPIGAIDARDKSTVDDRRVVAEAWKRSPADFIGWPPVKCTHLTSGADVA